MWLIGRYRLKELVNYVGRGVRDNLCNPGVAVARFAGGTELRVGNVIAPVFFRKAPAPAPRLPASAGAGGAEPRWSLAESAAPAPAQTQSSPPYRRHGTPGGPSAGPAPGRPEGHRAQCALV